MAWKHAPAGSHYARSRVGSHSDLEKRVRTDSDDEQYTDDDDYDYSEHSSRSVSSTQPMLSNAFPTALRSRRLLRLPNSIIRWVCWGIAIGIVLFVLSLVQMSWAADKAVKLAGMNKMAPKPPMWESFPFLTRYWGGIRTLVPYKDNEPEYPTDADQGGLPPPSTQQPEQQKRAVPESILFNPYPAYASQEYIQEYGDKVDCYLDAESQIEIPRVRMYEGRPQGFPEPIMGSAEVLGMRHDICYDRFGRMGAYGLGYGLAKGGSGAMEAGEREGADAVWVKYPEVDFRQVKWRDVQDRCFRANAHRFNTPEKPPSDRFRSMYVGQGVDSTQGTEKDSGKEVENEQKAKANSEPKPLSNPRSGLHKVQRTAVVIRTWVGYDYTVEDVMYIRSLISELGLLSGGEYSFHFLIHLKDNDAPIWSDEKVYDKILGEALPEEFRGMGTLWTEKQMGMLYPGLSESWMRDLPVHGVYRSTFMPMQYFAYQHPEYDFFWNWEMDVRNTGHWYHLFDSVSRWAKKQPRKYLWERNSRFYIPTAHRSWDEFNHTVRVNTEHGTNSPNNLWSVRGSSTPGTAPPQGDVPVWGPLRPEADDVAMEGDPEPPTPFDKDKYQWGVGEDADLITFNPLFDPEGTTWLLRDDTTGYTLKNGRHPPRRTAIITASRLSRRLLMTMHRETAEKRHTMFSEMWPASCALHHGFKAVYAPHAEYIDRKWPLDFFQATFNAGRNGATGGVRTSVFGDREHNFRGSTWYYNAGFSEVLWKRWIGLVVNNDGGEVAELAQEGRMCLPGMLLHPIKRVDLPQEGLKEESPSSGS